MKILLYNIKFNKERFSVYDVLKANFIENNPIFTTDISQYDSADVVVFNFPHFRDQLPKKRRGQIWVSWNIESVTNYPMLENKVLGAYVDIWMDYRLDSCIPIPYTNDTFIERIRDAKPLPFAEKKDVCMVISNGHSNRTHYIRELMKYIHIDSYGSLFKNSTLPNDTGYKSLLELYRKYKFVIAFENSICEDYVTEKFYNPLLVGSVPVYKGAPNIAKFAPTFDCYLDATRFEQPSDLAQRLKWLCNNEEAYIEYFKWKNEPINRHFIDICYQNAVSPFERLLNKLQPPCTSFCTEYE